jgi:transcription initiation factor TFIID subunit 2
LVDLLTYNDNAQNGYSDSFYITTIIAALGNTFVSANTKDQSEFSAAANGSNFSAPKEQQLLHAAVDEVTRYTNLDRLVPSYHNVITVAGIEVYFNALASSRNR